MSEPTSKLNNLSSETVTKLVSIIVAIVVFAVVLVPIVNGLADGNGDGGDGGSGESEKVVLNTFESISGVDLAPYKSYQLYNSSTTLTLPHEITYTLEDLIELQNQIESQVSGASDIELTILEVVDETDNGIAIGIFDDEIGITIPFSVSSGGPYYSINDITSFELTLTTDYILDCSLNNTESVHTTATQVIELSESEDGWMDTAPNTPKITVGSELMIYGFVYDENNHLERVLSDTTVLTEDMFSENHLRFTVEFGEGYTTEVDIELQPTDREGVFTGALWNLEGFIYKDGNIYAPDYAYSEIRYVSTYGYTQSESGSGSSTDSGGISGTAGTILKIIPVLVGVGVILAIVALFYDPRNLIRKD